MVVTFRRRKYSMENTDENAQFRRTIEDFQHFLNVREDNHKYIEHLLMDRLKVEAKLLEKLEFEIEELKHASLKNCPYCGLTRPKRYNRSSQTYRDPPKTVIVPKNLQFPTTSKESTPVETSEESLEDRLEVLNQKMEKMSNKTNGMLKRSIQLQDRSDQLDRHIDFVKGINRL